MTTTSLVPKITASLPELTPAAALVFHTRGQGALELLTYHAIRLHRGKPTLAEGTPLSPSDEQEILGLLASNDTVIPQIELNPEQLLFADRHQICWYAPPRKRLMHFHVQGKRSQREVTWPGLIFRVVDHHLYLTAFDGCERPTLDTPLFKAPLANVWTNAEVCTGTAVLPEASRIAEMPAWESVIFDSAFSHANDREVIAASRGFTDPIEFWQKHDHIERKNLVPSAVAATLRDWLTHSPKGNRRG